MTYSTAQVLRRLPSPPGAPLGYAEFWMPHAERDRDEWFLLWQRIILRDGRVCWYCKRRMSAAAGRPGTLDHVIPRIRGGSDHMSNLRAACDLCNVAKGTYLPETGPHRCEYPPSDPVGGLCRHCLTPRSKQGRKAAVLVEARLAVGPHECVYEPVSDPDALCGICTVGRSKSSRKALNKRLRKAD